MDTFESLVKYYHIISTVKKLEDIFRLYSNGYIECHINTVLLCAKKRIILHGPTHFSYHMS